MSIRNALIQEYGSLLMEHSSLWQVGAEYLSLCGKGGYRLLALTLERLPLKSEARSAKIIRIARKLKLPHIGKVTLVLLTLKYFEGSTRLLF